MFDRERFLRDGYAVIPGLFDRTEAEHIREQTVAQVEQLHAEGTAWVEEGTGGRALHPQGDMLTYPVLRDVLLDPRLISAIADVLGGRPTYWGESSVVVGSFGGARAWHTDSHGTQVTQGNEYPLIRCGLYLQDITKFSGGLALRPKTHARPLDQRFPPVSLTPIKLVSSVPGDLVVWDMRIWHAGEAVRLRQAPNLALPLSWQGRLPNGLRLPEERDRVVMFPTFALPGPDLDSYLEYQRGREYMRKIWEASRFGDDVWQRADAAGLDLLRAVPEFGTSAPEAPVGA